MKKTIVLLLITTLLLSMSACSYAVPDPLSYPDYTFTDAPDTMQLRMTAVQAMHDILSIQWCTEKEITYRKTGPVSHKQFLHEPGKTYAGLLYSNANTGLFQFLEFYNAQNGCLEYEGTSDELKKDIGSSCADALLWAWSTVCNSITGGFYPVMMVKANGYLPVGDYTYNFSISSYNQLPSYEIIEMHPKETIMAAYAEILPADALVTNSDNHAMMAIESANVCYLPDGSIDSANSYVMIQDQRAGGSTFYESVENGHKLHYSGRTSAKYTFDELYEGDYIPVTTAEFLGLEEYETASVTVQGGPCESMDDLLNMTIESNYPLAVCNIICVDAKGKQTVLDRVLFSGSSIPGVPRSYALSENESIEGFNDSPYNQESNVIRIEVVVSTGERFFPIELTI